MTKKRAADPAPSRARVDAASERHDDPRIPAVLEHIRGGTPIKNAFALEGIPKRTAYAWMEASEQLKDDVDMARAVASEARRKLFEADPSSPLLHYIQTLDPENFPTPAQRVEASGPGGGPIKQEIAVAEAPKSLEEAQARLEALQARLKGTKA